MLQPSHPSFVRIKRKSIYEIVQKQSCLQVLLVVME